MTHSIVGLGSLVAAGLFVGYMLPPSAVLVGIVS